jgi:predicted metal-binding membrane protein
MLWPRVDDRRPFLIVLVGLVALAWLALVVWGQSPYGRFLSHEALEDVQPGGGRYLATLLLFVGGWTIMTVAMMLPTSLPLVLLFRRLTQRRLDSALLVALLIAGYLSAWVAFGAAAHVGDLAVHRGIEQARWLEERAWVLGAATLALAGLYQFAPLKYHCLDKCRSPFSFIVEHWHGEGEATQAFRLGVHHGIFCVGCCWSLMLLMFAVGVGNVGWMLALGAVMGVEKNMPWGRRLSAPLGIALLAWSLSLVVVRTQVAGLLG